MLTLACQMGSFSFFIFALLGGVLSKPLLLLLAGLYALGPAYWAAYRYDQLNEKKA